MDPLILVVAFALGLAARSAGLPPLVGFLAAGFARPQALHRDLTYAHTRTSSQNAAVE